MSDLQYRTLAAAAISKILIDLKVKVNKEATEAKVCAEQMCLLSGLFDKEFGENSNNGTLEINVIEGTKETVNIFLAMCSGQNPKINRDDVFTLIKIAEEWDAQEVMKYLYTVSNEEFTKEELLDFYFQQLSKLGESKHRTFGKCGVEFMASNFNDNLVREKISELDARTIFEIIGNENFSRPKCRIFHNFLLSIIGKNQNNVELFQYFEPFSATADELKEAIAILEKYQMPGLFPDFELCLNNKLREETHRNKLFAIALNKANSMV